MQWWESQASGWASRFHEARCSQVTQASELVLLCMDGSAHGPDLIFSKRAINTPEGTWLSEAAHSTQSLESPSSGLPTKGLYSIVSITVYSFFNDGTLDYF